MLEGDASVRTHPEFHNRKEIIHSLFITRVSERCYPFPLTSYKRYYGRVIQKFD